MSLETLKRINVDKVRELFYSVGITPKRLDTTSCLMTAVAISEGVGQLELLYKNGWDGWYVAGCMCGWDNRGTFLYMESDERLKYNLGYADGTASRKIIFGA